MDFLLLVQAEQLTHMITNTAFSKIIDLVKPGNKTASALQRG